MAYIENLNSIHRDMMRRCYNKKSIMYNNYGGKGITVCPEWHERDAFIKWANENGFSRGLKLKRIDSSIGYSPDNCFFSDKNFIHPKQPRKELPEYLRKLAEGKKRSEERRRLRESYGVPEKYSSLRIYRVYRGMITRGSEAKGSDPSSQHIRKYYNKKGITVCDEWKGKEGFFRFYKWAMMNGYKDNLSIDRIDNSKGYFPGNCRWIPLGMQDRNRDNNVRYEYKGENLLLIEICEKENVSYDALKYRIVKRGQDIDYAISEIRKNKKRKEELNDPNINPIGCMVKDLRRRTGLTQKEFALKYNTTETVIQSWEEGVRIPEHSRIDNIKALINEEYGIDS